MLLSHEIHEDARRALDSVHNFYEGLVFNELYHMLSDTNPEDELLADIACVALNRLTPRYVSHDVDMMFYLSPQEQAEMEEKVRTILKDAIEFMEQHRNKE